MTPTHKNCCIQCKAWFFAGPYDIFCGGSKCSRTKSRSRRIDQGHPHPIALTAAFRTKLGNTPTDQWNQLLKEI